MPHIFILEVLLILKHFFSYRTWNDFDSIFGFKIRISVLSAFRVRPDLSVSLWYSWKIWLSDVLSSIHITLTSSAKPQALWITSELFVEGFSLIFMWLIFYCD